MVPKALIVVCYFVKDKHGEKTLKVNTCEKLTLSVGLFAHRRNGGMELECIHAFSAILYVSESKNSSSYRTVICI